MRITNLNRIFLLVAGLAAAYQVSVGINGLEDVPIIAYTIAFGVLLVAMLLIIILGIEVLDSPMVIIASTIIPLSLSLGLVWEHITEWRTAYLVFAVSGFLAVILTRTLHVPGNLPVLVLALVHGAAGMIVFLLPSILAAQGITRPGFALVGLGGSLIGLGGVLLTFLKTSSPTVSRETILSILPALFMLMSIVFVAGFALA
jgi:hypothetical protein